MLGDTYGISILKAARASKIHNDIVKNIISVLILTKEIYCFFIEKFFQFKTNRRSLCEVTLFSGLLVRPEQGGGEGDQPQPAGAWPRGGVAQFSGGVWSGIQLHQTGGHQCHPGEPGWGRGRPFIKQIGHCDSELKNASTSSFTIDYKYINLFFRSTCL